MRRIKGFTLIELLLVMAIIALLLAILMPALKRVKRQARSVACQSRLRQWGVAFTMYTQDYDGKFYDIYPLSPHVNRTLQMYKELQPYCGNSPKIIFCPEATKYVQLLEPPLNEGLISTGSTFTAWKSFAYWTDLFVYGSYGVNEWILDIDKWYDNTAPSKRDDIPERHWKTCLVKGAGSVPVFLDCAWMGWAASSTPPPSQEESFPNIEGRIGLWPFCMNRHDRGINGLFMDWSVRKVRLKELWTLKWHREFDTANEWTRAGGVKPDEWPEWMRNFKDY